MGSKTETKSSNTPWAPAQPYITGSLDSLQGANQQGQANLASNMPALNAAIGKITGILQKPPSYATDARAQLSKIINGDYINSNPYTGKIADQIAQRTGAQYNSTFGSAGRAHGGLAALLSAQGVGDALQSFYGNQYNGERQLQQQAIGMAPAFNQDEFVAGNALLPLVQGSAVLPGQVAGQYASGVANATSPYVQNTTTQKTGGLGQVLSTGLGLAAQIGGAIATGGTSLAAGGAGGLSGLLSSGNVMGGGSGFGSGGLSGLFPAFGGFGG